MPVVKYRRIVEAEYGLADGGVVTARQPEQLNESIQDSTRGYAVFSHEWSDVRNFEVDKINGEFRGWQSRSGCCSVNLDSPLSSVAGTTVQVNNMVFIDVGDHYDASVVGDNGYLYKLDRSSSTGVFSTIASVDSNSALVNIGLLYGDTVGENAIVVLGGSKCPHVYRPNATIGRSFHIAYDKGAYMTTQFANPQDGQFDLVGSTVRFGNEVTMSTWCDHGNSTIDGIPMTEMYAVLIASSTGIPGYVKGELYSGGGTLLSTSDPISASSVVDSWAGYDFTFSSVYNRQPGQTYREVISYTSGVGTTFISVGYTTNSDQAYSYSGAWSTFGGTALLGTLPGLAPTFDAGDVYNGRIFGLHPDGQNGYVHYCNVLDPFEWTADALSGSAIREAGPLAIGDAAGTVNNIVPVQESMFIIKGGEDAKVYRLEGASPSEYSLYEVMRGIGGTNFFAASNIGDDGYIYDRKGLVSLSILKDTMTISEAIKSHNVSNQFAGLSSIKMEYVYNNSQLWLYTPEQSKILVYDNEIDNWTFFEFKNGTITPTKIKTAPDGTYIADTNGKLWHIDGTEYYDDNSPFELYFKSAFSNVGSDWDRKVLDRLSLDIQCGIAGIGYVSLYRDSIYTSDWGKKFKVPLSGSLTVGDLYDTTVGALYGFVIPGSKSFGVYIYETGLSSGTYAGIELSQFGYGIDGPPQSGYDYVHKYDVNRVMTKVSLTTWAGVVRLRNITHRGAVIGRRMN